LRLLPVLDLSEGPILVSSQARGFVPCDIGCIVDLACALMYQARQGALYLATRSLAVRPGPARGVSSQAGGFVPCDVQSTRWTGSFCRFPVSSQAGGFVPCDRATRRSRASTGAGIKPGKGLCTLRLEPRDGARADPAPYQARQGASYLATNYQEP